MPDLVADLPYPLMVNALTGTRMDPVALENMGKIASNISGGANSQTILGVDPDAVHDANDLTQTGWGIIFADDASAPAIQAQLQPLIDLRRNQVHDLNLFKIFSGSQAPGPGVGPGVTPGQSASTWADQLGDSGVSLDAAVVPSQGLPYYLLIVGGPDQISFDFQADLKSQFVVGRLYFDDIEDYGRYARAVVQYEDPNIKPAQTKSAAVWVTRNYGDPATAMLSGVVVQDFIQSNTPLGSAKGFFLTSFANEKATKAQLIDILRGNLPSGPPAVIFTGSHGCDYSGADSDTQRRMQGSLVTQEWMPDTPANPANQFASGDVPADANLLGAIGFMFACFSGACPAVNSYYFNKDGSPIKLAPQPFMARLPQVLLSRGMLAVIAHIDMAFPYAFQTLSGTPQMQTIRSPLEQIMGGTRTGMAADILNSLCNSRANQLRRMQKQAQPSAAATPAAATGAPPASSPAAKALGQMAIACDDAGNYIVLGDPATQLRINDLK